MKPTTKHRLAIYLLLFFFMSLGNSLQAQTKRTYLIGNSITDNVDYSGFKTLAENAGFTHIWARHMIPGAPLEILWHNPNVGLTEDPYGPPETAFVNYEWDAVTLQPFDRKIFGTNHDLEIVGKYIDLAKSNSPDVQFYIYERWPRVTDGYPQTAQGWNDLWLRPYTGSWDGTMETRDFFVQLTQESRNAYTDVAPVRLIPVGSVFHNLNQKMAAGQIPGYSSIWDVYSDNIHADNVGEYIAGCTFFATIYQTDPRGTAVPSNYGTIDPVVASVIQETVWEVVTTEPLAGVSQGTVVPVTYVTIDQPSVTIEVGQTAQLTATVSPTDATNKNVSWSSGNSAVASVSASGLVSATGQGTTNITVTTADGNFTDVSTINATGSSGGGGSASGTLAAWDFNGQGGQSTVSATTLLQGVSGASTAFGPGLSAYNYLSDGFTARSQKMLTLQDAITEGEYMSFTVTPTSGNSITINNVQVRPVSQNVTRSFVLFSSVTGFTAGSEIASFTASGGLGNDLQSLTIANHTNISTSVEFRLYIYGHDDSWESVGAGNRNNSDLYDLIVEGSVNGGSSDTEAPSAPSNITSTSITTTSVELTWDVSTDNVGVVGYDVYNGSTKENSTNITSNSYTVQNLTACTDYSFEVVAKDAAGNTSSSAALAVKTNCIPTAVINASPTSGTAPLEVSFDAAGSSDPDANDYILGFDWDFGDGSAHSNANAPSHTYTSAGTYTVTLRVMDNRNAYSEPVTSQITVSSGSSGSLPSPWQNQDIGNTGVAGSASYNNGTFTIEGSGSDIWNTADGFQYVYQSLNGDGEIVAKVLSQTNTDNWAKAGVMIREDLTSGSKHAMTVITPANGVSFQRRTATGSTSSSTGVGSASVPIWVKIERTGNTFNSYQSTDGSNWTQIGTTLTITMAQDVYIGLCVTSHKNTVASIATIDNVIVSGSGGNDTEPPTSPSNVTASSIAETSVGLTWNVSTDNVGVVGYDIYNGSTKVNSASITGNIYTIQNLTACTGYSFTVVANDAAGNTASSPALDVTTECSSALRNPENPANTVNGVDYKYYHGTWNDLPDFNNLTPEKTGTLSNFDLSVRTQNDNFGFMYSGYIDVPSDGDYTFYTSSDDGSKLYIGSTEVVDNDGLHAIQERLGSIGLKAGKHAIRVTFFEKTGGESLTVSYSGPGITKQAIPSSALHIVSSGNDTEAPSIPTNLSSSLVEETSFTVSWTASTDNSGVSGYNIYLDGNLHSSTNQISSSISGLLPTTTYNVAVSAYDQAGNESTQSSVLQVTTLNQEPTTRANNIGMNPNGPLLDYNETKPLADAMRTHRYWDVGNASLDENYWPLHDATVLVYHGLDTRNNHGTYKLYFKGQADVSSGEATISNLSYDAATNTTSGDLVISDNNNSVLYIAFNNTIRTPGSGTNTGVYDVKLMRPVSPGSSVSYDTTVVFNQSFLTALEPFSTLRFMDWTSTNACGDVYWTDRTLWTHATQHPPELPGRTYGWQGRGGSWESVIMLSNKLNADAYICVPHKATENYIRQLALLFRDGNEHTEPLKPGLKLYVEYSNEIWNWGGAFSQTPDVRDMSINYGHPIDFDGETDPGHLMYRLKGHKTVRISEIFREVFGDGQMMTRIRPVIMWQKGYSDLTSRTLTFIEGYYGGLDPLSDVTDPRPLKYYIYGGSGTSYWSCEPSNSITLDNIWDSKAFNTDVWIESIGQDAVWAKAFGLEQIAYEGNTHTNGNAHADAILKQASWDPRMKDEFLEHQEAWNSIDGGLNCYFTLQGGGQISVLRDNLDDLNTPKYQALVEMTTATPARVTYGHTAPFSVSGGMYHQNSNGWGNPSEGTTRISEGGRSYFRAYAFHPGNAGSYNIEIEYSTTSSAILQLTLEGETIASFNLSSTGGAAKWSSATNVELEYDKLYVLRVVTASGSVTIHRINVNSGLKSSKLYNNENESLTDKKLMIYPNPVLENTSVTISGLQSDEIMQLSIMNVAGKMISTNTIDTKHDKYTMQLDNLKSGIYFIKVNTNSRSIVKKLIIR